MNASQLRKLQSSPRAFREALVIDTDRGPMPLSDVIDDWQREDFEALDSGWQAAVGQNTKPKFSRCWLERPRGHSKTSDLAVMCSWALFASCSRLSGVAAAADQDQALLLREAISRIVQFNGWLQGIFDVQKTRVINRHTGSTLEILTSDAPSSYGLTPHFIIADEVTHWQKRDLWDSLLSSSAKRSNCLLLVICNAGHVGHWAWDTREAVRNDARWHFSRLDGPQASWLSPQSLDEQRRLLPPKVFARLWLNQWQDGSGDALDNVDEAVTLNGPQYVQHRGMIYVAGLDIGISRDATGLVTLGIDAGYTETKTQEHGHGLCATTRALIDNGVFPSPRRETKHIYHPGTGRLRLVDVRLWQPQAGKVQLEDVEAAIVEAHQRYRLASIAVDPWQAEHLTQRLQKRGLPIQGVSFTGPNLQSMASVVMDSFRERNIDLYAHTELLADLKNLRIVERSYGYRLESPKNNTQGGTRHGDSATALGLAMFAAKRFTHRACAGARDVVRARFGGQVVDSDAFAKIADAQS